MQSALWCRGKNLHWCSSCKIPSSVRLISKLFVTTTTQDISYYLHFHMRQLGLWEVVTWPWSKEASWYLVINWLTKNQRESWTQRVQGSSCAVTNTCFWFPAQPLLRYVTWTICLASWCLIYIHGFIYGFLICPHLSYGQKQYFLPRKTVFND